MALKIALVEDDSSIRAMLEYYFKSLGHEIAAFESGEDFFAASPKADLALLDVMLPGMDGLEILRRLRADPETAKLPIIMLTARQSEMDKVAGLDAGADDYLVKPFAFEELLARLRVLLRKPVTEKSSILNVADLSLHVDTRRVFRGDRELQLSSKEYSLLHYMMQNAGVVLSRDKLEQHVWDYDFSGGSNVIDVYIRFLRKKVDEGYDKKLIHTVRGHGYVLKDDTL